MYLVSAVTNRPISDDESAGVFFNNTTVGGNSANNKARRDRMICLNIRLCPGVCLGVLAKSIQV